MESEEKTSGASNDNILTVRKIYHYYGKAKALEELNLNVDQGSLDAIIGPNGAGKTTLLRAISGLEEIDRGSITFKGQRIDAMEAHDIARAGIAHCPEHRKLFSDMSVLENLEMGAYCIKDPKKMKQSLGVVFAMFPVLKERKNQRAGTLSGGEQQMLAIGRALMSSPSLILLDEPTLGLSPKYKGIVLEVIKSFKNSKTTTLLVEQDAAFAMDIAENIHVLEEGKVEMRGTREELEREPRIKETYLGIK